MLSLKSFGSIDIGFHVNGDRAYWGSRLVCAWGPVPSEVQGLSGGAPVVAWERKLAGLPCEAFDSSWRDEVRTDTWTRIGSLDSKALSEALKACLVVAKPDSPRSYATVVALEPDGTLVATDGFRLVWTKSSLCPPNRVTLPVSGLKLLLKVLKKLGPMEALLSEDETTLCLKSESLTLCLRTSAVKYPAWSAIIPKAQGKEVLSEELDKVLVDAEAKSKAAKRSEEVHSEICGVPFNARFLKDLPAGRVHLGVDPESDPLVVLGPVNALLCPVIRNKEAPRKGA